MAALQGYRTQQKIGQSQYQTYQQVGRAGSGSYAADTVSKVLWDTTPLNVAVEADSTKLIINATAHTALPGDMLRFIATSANPGIEVGVVSVTANTITLGGELPALPLLADEFKVMRWITPTADQNGNLVFTPGPTTFNKDGVITTVAEDTANPANNTGLPVNIVFYKDGVPVTVNVDSVTPANNRLLPVELSSLAGPINVTAGDLNVAIDSTNDSTAIGDAVTGSKAIVSANDDTTTFALKVKDDDANTKLGNIILDTLALSATTGLAGSFSGLDGISVHGTDGTDRRTLRTDVDGHLQIDILTSPLPTGASTEAEQILQTAELTAIKTAVQLIDDTVNTDGNPAGTAGLMIGGEDASGDFQNVRVNTNGELSVTFGSAGFATETTLSALNNKVANDYGASSGAVRTASQIGNTTGQADFGVGADGAQTLRVSANLKRSGNELTYNSGAADANTLRTVLATRHEASATPLAMRASDGTNFLANVTISGQGVLDTTSRISEVSAAYMLGWTGTQHRQIRVNSNGFLESNTKQVISIEESSSSLSGASPTLFGSFGASIRWIKVLADANNTDNLRVRLDATASATQGYQLQPGREVEFKCSGQLSIISENAAATGEKVFILYGSEQ